MKKKYEVSDLDVAISYDVDIIVELMTKHRVNYNTAVEMLNKAKMLKIMNDAQLACLMASTTSLDEVVSRVEELNK